MSFYGRCLHKLLFALVFWFKTVQMYNVHANDETEHIRPEGAKKQNKNKVNKQRTMFIKTRLRITVYAMTVEGIRMDSESSAKLSTNCWCGGLFFFSVTNNVHL